jgi:hypothetical protein
MIRKVFSDSPQALPQGNLVEMTVLEIDSMDGLVVTNTADQNVHQAVLRVNIHGRQTKPL